MKAIVSWFSGTGNSLAAAGAIAGAARDAEEEADLVPIASLSERDAVRPDAEVVGIVFPVYYARSPAVVERFIG